MLFAVPVNCLLFGVRCVLCVASRLLLADCYLMFAVYCLLLGVCRVLFVVGYVFAVCCSLCFFLLCDVCCLLFVVCCLRLAANY